MQGLLSIVFFMKCTVIFKRGNDLTPR